MTDDQAKRGANVSGQLAGLQVDDVRALVEVTGRVLTVFKNQPWWRGHGMLEWNLMPAVYRVTNRGEHYEQSIANKFVQLAVSRHHNCPLPGQFHRWLFLMQHSGLPTRLLDWSESAMIALYFVVANRAHWDVDGALWALDPFELNRVEADFPGLLQPGSVSHIIDGAFGGKQSGGTVALVTEEIDPKMMAQLSGFTIHGNATPLEQVLSARDYLAKFAVPAAAKPRILQQLAAMGVRPRTVFPDLAHLAADLRDGEY